jgi:hypothetical protein
MTQNRPLDPNRWRFEEPKNSTSNLPSPPGFGFVNAKNQSVVGHRTQSSNKQILEKRSWDMALAPGKSIFMNIFMLWMMGSGSGIFSILMVGYAVMQSFNSLIRVNEGMFLYIEA